MRLQQITYTYVLTVSLRRSKKVADKFSPKIKVELTVETAVLSFPHKMDTIDKWIRFRFMQFSWLLPNRYYWLKFTPRYTTYKVYEVYKVYDDKSLRLSSNTLGRLLGSGVFHFADTKSNRIASYEMIAPAGNIAVVLFELKFSVP